MSELQIDSRTKLARNLPKKIRVALVAGEMSGDKLGAELMAQLKTKFPQIIFEGIGGTEMIQQGLKSIYSMERLSVMGIGAIVKRLPELLKLRKNLIYLWGVQNPPDLFIGIDAPVFNTTLELKLKNKGVKTVHYVSPSVWAWRPGRIKKIARAVDHMLTLFPFETTIYQQHQVAVSCVGHPMADTIPIENQQQLSREKLAIDADKTVVALLPGSRGSELKYLAPLFLEVAEKLHQQRPDITFVTAMANEKCNKIFKRYRSQYPNLPLKIFQQQSREVMAAADLVLISSGTATLEAALLKRPMIVSYKMAPISYQLIHHLSALDYYALPNLLMGKALVPEFLQDDATVDKIVPAALKILQASDEAKCQLQQAFIQLHHSLKQGGSKKAADVIEQILQDSLC